MNIVKTWEVKAKLAMRMNHDGTGYSKKHYEKALAYCDCINDFTTDQDKWDCYDRLMQEMLAEIEADEMAYA